MEQGFERSTGVRAAGDGRWEATLDRGWWVARGPNGGYLAAIVLRALSAAVADPARPPRSLTLHYLAPPEEGEIEIAARVERSGRSLTSASARVTQGERKVALALAAFSGDWPARHDFTALSPPLAADPESSPPPRRRDGRPPVFRRWQFRSPLGPPPLTGGDEALSGGWMRLDPPRIADEFVVAAMTDAWYPAVFGVLSETTGLPTVDLTIHFRVPLPLETATSEDWYLTRFTSGASAGGFVEEDGEIWSAGGVLLAQSRQLALVL
ncbi:MAG TPA: thioesterase family protein [Thermoleophilaceae bacterium]|nr:thioesterase family protein [Thermoleophilaceae bacterium]